jgi:hypothetical protein
MVKELIFILRVLRMKPQSDIIVVNNGMYPT